MAKRGMDSSDSRHEQVASCYEEANEPPGCIKCEELVLLKCHQLLTKDSLPRSQLLVAIYEYGDGATLRL
jgi:hypothetical protein